MAARGKKRRKEIKAREKGRKKENKKPTSSLFPLLIALRNILQYLSYPFTSIIQTHR